MVELRKRKAPEAPAPAKAAPASKKKASTAAAKDAKPAAAAPPPAAAAAPAASAESKLNGDTAALKPGDTIPLSDSAFTATIRTHDDAETSVAALLAASSAGLVLFTYPKASTPGCTTQACLFRDSYAPLSAAGLAVHGLSADSPKANASFRAKQALPYPLLCDPDFAVIGALGFRKPPKSTQRGVFVVDKAGKVLALEPGGPAATLDVVKRVIAEMEAGAEKAGEGGSASL